MRRLKLPGRDVSKPRLDEQDIELIQQVGIDGVREQARSMVEKKLRKKPGNDGEQTPIGGNPVYKAMHACNVASREEMHLAHGIPDDKELTDNQVESISSLLSRWVAREYNFFMEEREQQQSNLGDFGKA
ncbi:MAG: DUF4186 family protein [Candidatus Nanohaloarchaea archaeon]